MASRGSRMWSPAGPVLAVTVLVSLLQLAAAAQFSVGEYKGWTTHVNYTKWASRRTFSEGDTLEFLYTRGTHDVLRVGQADYEACRSSNPIETDGSGQTTFQLRAGSYYFICGFPGHCKQSQKLAFTVNPPPAITSPRVNQIGDLPTPDRQPDAPAEGPSGAFGAAVTFQPTFLLSVLTVIFEGILLGCF